MSRTGNRSERERWSQMLQSKLVDSELTAMNLGGCLSSFSDGRPGNCSAEIIRAKSTGRMTIRFEVNNVEVYGKAYYDEKLGRRAYQWLSYLWKNGFSEASNEQVPQPLGFLPEENLLFMRAAAGIRVSEALLEAPLRQAVYLIRAAAQWLAKFHATVIPDLEVEPPCEAIEILKTTALLAKVAAACPERMPLLLDLVHQWKTLAPATNLPGRLVPLHGQFRPAHVFVDGAKVVVIDLDKIRLSDPAKDVARFIHVMMKSCMEVQGDFSRIALLADEFAGAYGSFSPGNLANLRYYSSLYSLKELAKVVKSDKIGAERKALTEQLYIAAFTRCVTSDPRLRFAA